MARNASGYALCTILIDAATGEKVIVETLDTYTEKQLPEAKRALQARRDAAKVEGANPYDYVLLPDGKGGPYLP